MSRTITVASQKGGVGKTTITLNLGYCLGRMAGGTLLIDLDPQGGMALASNLRNRTRLGLFDILKKRAKPEEALAEASDSSITVLGLGEVAPSEIPLFEEAAWDGSLGQVVADMSAKFHYILIDAPAGIGGVVHAALSVSQGVLLVCDCSALTLKSVPVFLAVVEHIKEKFNPALRLEGVLISLFDDTSPNDRTVLEQVREIFPPEALFNTLIPYDAAFEEASLDAAPAVLTDTSLKIKRLFLELASELRERELAALHKALATDGPPRLF